MSLNQPSCQSQAARREKPSSCTVFIDLNISLYSGPKEWQKQKNVFANLLESSVETLLQNKWLELPQIRTFKARSTKSIQVRKIQTGTVWKRACIDFKIRLNFESNRQQNKYKYKRSIIHWNHLNKLCWRQNELICAKLEYSHHKHKKMTA